MSNRNKKANPPVKCSHDAMVDINLLSEFPTNYNEHGEKQLDLLGKIITEQGWRNPVVVSKRSNYVIRGHGRIEAARRIGLSEVPVDYQDYDSDLQEKLDLVADNQIAKLANPNNGILSDLLLELDAHNIDMDLTGFDSDALVDFMLPVIPEPDMGADNPYTSRTGTPIYEPKEEEAPPIFSLFEESKVHELMTEIQQVETEIGLDPEIRDFLMHSAQRHRKFNFKKIAEYYAHADKNVQKLFENSALVIIDFDAAIEQGYVSLRDELIDRFLNE
mgnify:CR=1 FL=1